MKIKFIGFLVMVLFIIGCKDSVKQGGTVVEREGNSSIHMVESEDKEMKKAIAEARASVSTFIANLQNPKPDQTYFSVKKMFTDGPYKEHIWLTEVTYDGQYFLGVVANEPVDVRNIGYGDDVSVSPTEISDWMFVEKNKLKGGYTIRALKKKLSHDKQKEYDQSLPFEIE